MAIIVHTANDIRPFMGKTVLRVSMSAFEIGLHGMADSAFLIEAPWSLQDKEGNELDRNYGIRIRKSTSLAVLVGQTLRKLETGAAFIILSFDRHYLRVSLLSDPYRLVNTGVLGGFAQTPLNVRWDPLELTSPGYLLGKKGKKKASVYKVRGGRKDPEDMTFLFGQAVSRVSWSAVDGEIYFQGQQRLIVECRWRLLDAAGEELDREMPLPQRQGTALFSLIGRALLTIENWSGGKMFCFEEGLRLEISKRS